MSGETDASAGEDARTARIAWLVSFAIPAVVLGILLLVTQPSDAAVVSPPPLEPPAGVDEEGEEEETEEVEETEEEEEEEEELETSPYPPDECLLRTARARIFTYTSRDRVRLVIRYTSLAPADVTVDYWMKGKKGPLSLGHAKQRFSKKGLFRLTEKLSDSEMAKVRAAKGFMVKMEIPAAPSYCSRYHSRHLTIKRAVHSQVVWFQSDSIFGTDR